MLFVKIWEIQLYFGQKFHPNNYSYTMKMSVISYSMPRKLGKVFHLIIATICIFSLLAIVQIINELRFLWNLPAFFPSVSLYCCFISRCISRVSSNVKFLASSRSRLRTEAIREELIDILFVLYKCLLKQQVSWTLCHKLKSWSYNKNVSCIKWHFYFQIRFTEKLIVFVLKILR